MAVRKPYGFHCPPAILRPVRHSGQRVRRFVGYRKAWRPGRPPLPLYAAALLLAGCSGHRDVLNPASEEARHISGLWWIYCGVCVAVFLLVMAFLLGAIRRAQRQTPAALAAEPLVVSSTDPRERTSFSIVTGSTVLTVVVLFALLIVDFATGRAMRAPADPSPLTIKITGHQWWWHIQYDDPTPSNIITTANELHLPVNRPVQLILQSSDVIHSFWIPNLQGKKDLVPGHPTTLWLKPDRIGRYNGQCAEFCGYQHAHMGLIAIVESPEDFARWQDTQRKPAPEPQTDTQKRGRDVFLTTSCVLCHAIQGTPANSHVGPPLTHLASQRTIGANSFPNQRGYLAGWIVDPQSMKPGVRMPQNSLSADDLNALLDYLETLQ